MNDPQNDQPSALLKLAMRLYNRGYRSGHHYTVEGGYTDIFECDMENYHEEEAREIVQDFLGSNLTDADLRDIQIIFDESPLPLPNVAVSHARRQPINLSNTMNDKPASESPEVVTSKDIGSTALLGSVWIVVGETGEYSDYTEWNVAAYPTEEEANKHRDAAQLEADKVNGKDYRVLRKGFKNAYDSQYYCDYTGTKYRVEMVELHSAFLPTDNVNLSTP